MAYNLLDEIRRNAALEQLMGAADAGWSVYTSGLGELAGGLTYMPAAMMGGDAAGQAVKQATAQAITYQPRTDVGQQHMAALANLVQPVADVSSKAGKGFANAVYYDTESPALAALATAAPQALAEFAGRFRGMPKHRQSAAMSPESAAKLDTLREEVRSLIGEPNGDAEFMASWEKLTSAQRERLNYLEGYAIPEAKHQAAKDARAGKKSAPSQEALSAEYLSPDEVPEEVMSHVRKGSPITQDATDAVRWARIVGTQNEPRLGGGQVILYRAVDGDGIRPGDWVTTNKQYAEDHLRKSLKGKGRVVSMSVSGDDVLLGPTGDADELFYAPLELSAPYKPRK